MRLTLERISSGPNSTIGVLYLDGKFECFTCEDEYREEKVAGETRIPAGEYQIRLRTWGGFNDRYKNRFDFHEGMLEICEVPNFADILIHVGNDEGDTAGCVLVGLSAEAAEEGGGRVLFSTKAYGLLYKKVVTEARAARLVIEIIDRDNGEL